MSRKPNLVRWGLLAATVYVVLVAAACALAVTP